MAFDRARLEDHIKRAEAPLGRPVLFPYEDSVGLITIGWGRNLNNNGITLKEAQFLFNTDFHDALQDAASLPYWERLCGARQMVIVDMVFNLGLTRFLRFPKLNAALAVGDYILTAHEMKDSKWYSQVGSRARKLRRIMLTGEWKDG